MIKEDEYVGEGEHKGVGDADWKTSMRLSSAMRNTWKRVQLVTLYPRRLYFHAKKNEYFGSLYKCSDNGWINEDLFYQWLKHFTGHATPTIEEPVLLILDNHASHTSLAVYEHCKENNIHMLSLPPHTLHRMQPLDIVF